MQEFCLMEFVDYCPIDIDVIVDIIINSLSQFLSAYIIVLFGFPSKAAMTS